MLDIFVPKLFFLSYNSSLSTKCTSVSVDENDREMKADGEWDYIDKEEGVRLTAEEGVHLDLSDDDVHFEAEDSAEYEQKNNDDNAEYEQENAEYEQQAAAGLRIDSDAHLSMHDHSHTHFLALYIVFGTLTSKFDIAFFCSMRSR